MIYMVFVHTSLDPNWEPIMKKSIAIVTNRYVCCALVYKKSQGWQDMSCSNYFQGNRGAMYRRMRNCNESH